MNRPLIRIVKDWDAPDLLRQTPGCTGLWQGIRFTLDPVADCDLLLVLNNRLRQAVDVRCPGEGIWALMQEPYIPGLHDWMVTELGAFARVYSHYPPAAGPSWVRSHPALPWLIDRSYDELVHLEIPAKRRMVSWISSNLTLLPLHRRRLALLRHLAERLPALDIYGKGFQYITDKFDALAPYHFSIVVENSTGTDYWSEKLMDAFLCWTVPFYYGCSNLADYFPEEAFIPIDVDDPESSLATIRTLATPGNWRRRLEALREARELCLNRYQLFPFIAGQLTEHRTGTDRTLHHIPAVGNKRLMFWRRHLHLLLRQRDWRQMLRLITNKLRYLKWH
jgi:hypothetical protein